MNNKHTQTEIAYLVSLIYLGLSFMFMALLPLFVIEQIKIAGWSWKYMLTLISLAAGIFCSYQAICLSRIWTTGETGDTSCPFYLLKQLYSGNWEDKGGQEKQAKKAIKKTAAMVILAHTVVYTISYMTLT